MTIYRIPPGTPVRVKKRNAEWRSHKTRKELTFYRQYLRRTYEDNPKLVFPWGEWLILVEAKRIEYP